MLMFSLLFSNAVCCTKQRIRKAIYNLNGTRLSYDDSVNICIGLFVINLIITDLIVKSQVITILLYLVTSSAIPVIIITCVGSSINIYLVLSIYYETKSLVKTITCTCENELLREHVD